MDKFKGFQKSIQIDWRALVSNLRREGTPKRVHHMELYHDGEIGDGIAARYDLLKGLDPTDPYFGFKRQIAIRRFLGFDNIGAGLEGIDFPTNQTISSSGRSFMNEQAGPITSWEDFNKYPWPDPNKPEATAGLEWCEKNLPEDMCIFSQTGHVCEFLTWLMGYETLCIALYEQRDLVEALIQKAMEYNTSEVRRCLQFSRVQAIFASDDMGFRTGLLFSPTDMRKLVLPVHKKLASLAHDAGKLYLLHSCGNLKDIMDELVDDVGVDAKQSFEDTIEDCRDAKKTWGQRAGIIGGIDMDFLCRQDEQAIRARVRDTLDKCMPGGGYCLGTGNTAAGYIPLDHYLAMVDEGRLYS